MFKNPLAATSAVDRIVHNNIIIEFGKEISNLQG
jgi:hypothetical protein